MNQSPAPSPFPISTLFGDMGNQGRPKKTTTQDVIIVENTENKQCLQVFLPVRRTTISMSKATHRDIRVVNCLGLKKGTVPRTTAVDLWFDDKAQCHVFTFRDAELDGVSQYIYMKGMDSSYTYRGQGNMRVPLAPHSWAALRAFISAWVGEVRHQKPDWAK